MTSGELDDEYYDRLREANESVDFSFRLHEYRDFRDRKVLDVGCGNGYVLSRFAREGADVSGVDLTDAAVGLCRKRFEYLGLSGAFRRGNAEALPLPDGSLDCVTSIGVLHDTPDTAKAVAEVHRVLGAFTDLELWAGLLEGEMIVPRAGRFVPAPVPRALEPRLGWFLHAKGRKPA